ncbi:hypothetical protein [Kamptonema sp. UHCC 0994]|uniref:hypothetical protein n=1 Tax=Kamptonema sp. UHCC 0994 TaxID=3031329 RepID=UPI0023B95F21|nr:hypothetical protein [Kamptonema sp. UHCC 0994]MDF0555667.1 hypothetical protein [Kamptonema sp. UHCC 0994]
MDDLDGRLSVLIAEIRQNPANSRKWRTAINKLLLQIQQLPGLKKSAHQNYPQALNLTLQWVSREIANFEPRPPSVSTSFVNWINGHLKWRIKDLDVVDKKAPITISLDAPIATDVGETTRLDLLPDLTLGGLDGMIESAQKETTQRIGVELERYIEQDPEQKLRNSYPRSHPKCNCQFLSMRRLLKDPPDRFQALANELNVNYTTLNSHWGRKCEPLLQEIARSLGYKQEPKP